ncbi:hypothetical protein N656DRAFT_800360 [Canariomyces notabilis]|uniref:Uncharacterized protein n=1 Tax=Canariomyces notabilis TaxID=2074819 RepID=A0AAN6QPG8_9PEZI|nr:hypothetical protein N656DRAFT_800360 [Canariomyces arenarius]
MAPDALDCLIWLAGGTPHAKARAHVEKKMTKKKQKTKKDDKKGTTANENEDKPPSTASSPLIQECPPSQVSGASHHGPPRPSGALGFYNDPPASVHSRSHRSDADSIRPESSVSQRSARASSHYSGSRHSGSRHSVHDASRSAGPYLSPELVPAYRGTRDVIRVLRKAIDILEKQADYDAAVEKRHFD